MARLQITAAMAAIAIGTILPETVLADTSPEWIARLPVDSALSAGLAGMVVNADGVTYVTGVNGSSSNTNALTAAIAPGGVLLWQQVFNGPANWHDQARGIALGPAGDVYVCGNTPGPGTYANVLLLQYGAATGDHLGTVQYSSGPFTSEHGASVATDAQGNVYIGGGTTGDGGDGLMLSFDTQGLFRWKKTHDGPAFGPYSQDHIEQVKVDPNGDVVAMIHGVMNSLHPDYVVIKYAAADGAIVWQTNWGVNGGDFPTDMKIDAGGDVYVTGTGINFTDQYSTIKLRGTDGELLWQEYDSASIDDSARALALDGQGGVYITGAADPDGDHSNFNDNIYTVKRDAASGALLWSHLYGANCIGCYDVPSDVIVDTAGHAFVAGSTNSPPYSGDAILLVLDAATGMEIDRSTVSGGTNENAESEILRFDAAYNLYVGGELYNYNTGAVDISVMKYASLIEVFGDLNGDGLVDLADYTMFADCFAGPGSTPPCGSTTQVQADADEDGDTDLADFVMMQRLLGEP